ncbi:MULTISPECIES: DUF1330 domain-containing protein [unclassified Tenacibaculum]|uniref:DUF1330 domain-containing protein n=1 Tax=unclassified Tenacibaculum TaxID=2635139 RepID=UPI001F2B8D96|nr:MULTISPECIES: DUF1330 domain-containing protein [unclassified Tenacibaculum]MCF2876429.1 DUF1330 domain-containing protein [Tenacibaculum sp. Cn5-1]MCF2936428.1 DUF1330 domain-containing protein [Tenacibaculum sp. Cn5-34]MCG7512847.1 DUF1330 domain-containing protein [Tenacibaculum sp. Cn5-46]
MKAYMLAFVRVNDLETFNKEYIENAVPIVQRHGGVTVAVDENPLTIEGAVPEGRVVIVEFPTKVAAEAFYNDPEYQAIKAWRQKVSQSDSIILEKGF